MSSKLLISKSRLFTYLIFCVIIGISISIIVFFFIHKFPYKRNIYHFNRSQHHLKHHFNKIDLNDNQFISNEELDVFISKLINKIDTNNDNRIQLDELSTKIIKQNQDLGKKILQEKSVSNNEAKDLLKKVYLSSDLDNNVQINWQEFKSNYQLRLFLKMDENKDGLISKQEFLKNSISEKYRHTKP